MIQSVANFGWGVSSTVSDVYSFLGTTVNASTGMARLSSLANHLNYHYRRLFRESDAKLFYLDSMQIGLSEVGMRASEY